MQINEESPVKRLAHGDSSARGTVVTKGLRLWRVCRVHTPELKRPRVSPEMRGLSCLWVPPVSRALEAAVSSLVMPGGLPAAARPGDQPNQSRSLDRVPACPLPECPGIILPCPWLAVLPAFGEEEYLVWCFLFML